MTTKRKSEPFWVDEPDWLCVVEFLNDEDTEDRDLAAEMIGYLWGYARLTNARSLALLGDPSAKAYEILFSFSTPTAKAQFLELVRSNDELGNNYIKTDLLRPILDEIRDARPIVEVLPPDVLVRATLVAATICSATLDDNIH